MKHAFLIIAHNDIEQLKALVSALDYAENDIYIHFDKKTSKADESLKNLETRNANINIFREYNVRWGDETQVKCELFLMRKAYNDGFHDYYHIISGVDYPIKKQRDINAFFCRNINKEFVHFDTHKINPKDKERILYFHLFSRFYKLTKYKIIHRIMFSLDEICIKLQKLIGIKRNFPYLTLQKGCNWCSITHNFVAYVLQEKKNILNMVRYSKCADEIFLQTLIVNSKFIGNLYMPTFDNDYNQCARLIIWDVNNPKYPKTLTLCDFDTIIQSEALFARKITSLNSKPLIDQICKYQEGSK